MSEETILNTAPVNTIQISQVFLYSVNYYHYSSISCNGNYIPSLNNKVLLKLLALPKSWHINIGHAALM